MAAGAYHAQILPNLSVCSFISHENSLKAFFATADPMDAMGYNEILIVQLCLGESLLASDRVYHGRESYFENIVGARRQRRRPRGRIARSPIRFR